MADRGLPGALAPARPTAPVDTLLATLAALAAAALYLRTLTPGLLTGDSGEFQFAAWLGGFAHPTGYPLYLILGYLWTHLLPLHDPAWRMNAFSALWAAVAVGVTYWVALYSLVLTRQDPERRGFAGERAAALLAALTLAASPTFWSQAVIAEVYSLNAALCAGTLLSALIWAWRAREKREDARRALLATAALLGLGLAHHRTIILLAPALLLFWWRVRRGVGSSTPLHPSSALAPLLLVCLPLLLNLYIPLRAPGAPYAHVQIGPDQTLDLYQADLPGFIRYITGQGFSGELLGGRQALANVGPALRQMAAELTVPGLLLAGLGLLKMARRFRPLAALTATAFITMTVFNLFYGIGDIHVFYIPPYLLLTLWLAVGVGAVGSAAATTVRRQTARPTVNPARKASAATAGVILVAFALPAYLTAANFPRLDQSANTQASAGWHELLTKAIPANAILVSNDRDEMTPLLYCQHVEGLRPDLTGLFPLLGPAAEWGDIGQVVDTALRSGRPVLLVKPMPGLEVKYRLEAAGRLVAVMGPAIEQTPERARSIEFGGALRLNGYDLRPDTLAPNSHLSVALYWQPTALLNADYTTFVHIVNAAGVMIAQDDHRPGGEYYPSHMWRPGELLLDIHQLSLPAEPGHGPYRIVAGAYTQTAAIEHLGRPEQIGVIGIARPPDALPAELEHPLDFTFDNQLALNGYEMQMEGDILSLRLYWQALRAPNIDYTLFVHVLDEQGNIVAQSDQQPAGGEMPTSTWPRGYLLADRMDIRLPAGLAPGTYRLEAGVYDPATVVPLPAQNERGRPVGQSAPLGEFRKPN